MSDPLRVLLVSSEAVPFAKTGGLGDVVGALAVALRTRGIDARLVLPRYGWIDRRPLQLQPRPLGVPINGSEHWCGVLETRHKDVPVYFLEHDALYDRPHVYGPPGDSYGDNCLRFSVLSRGALQLCAYLDWWPDIVHANDWQAALAPVFLNTLRHGTPLEGTASVITIHNLAHQGYFSPDRIGETGLAPQHAEQLGLRAPAGINLLQGGILHGTLITTVSPSYADEIQTATYGEGLDWVLRSRRGDLFGVLNGIDLETWDPATDPHLPKNYSAEDRSGKPFCKAELQRAAGLALEPHTPLIGVVSRLAYQKGIDLIAASAQRIVELGAQLVLLGTGDPWAEHFFHELSRRYPGRCGAWLKFDESRAHLIEAGSDLFLMPSRWEPCGLNQMYSQRYGTLPVVRATGGLNDTVDNFDESTGVGTGFKFYDATPEALFNTVAWAVHTYRENRAAFDGLVGQAMALSHGWDRAAATYEYLYRLALVRRRG